MSDTDTGLTALQLKALRTCDDAYFMHYEGKSYIDCIKRKDRDSNDPWAEDKKVRIPCDTRWTDYSRESGMSYPVPEFKASQGLGNYEDSELRTLVGLLRAGDKLTLYWMRDAGRTEALATTVFHHDRLGLVVERGGKHMRFHIASSVCPDNTARMIRDVRVKPEQSA